MLKAATLIFTIKWAIGVRLSFD